jgi:hypothetical protein
MTDFIPAATLPVKYVDGLNAEGRANGVKFIPELVSGVPTLEYSVAPAAITSDIYVAGWDDYL